VIYYIHNCMYLRHAADLALRNCEVELISKSYVLAYGTDCFDMHIGVIEPGELDDLVATNEILSIRLIHEHLLHVIIFLKLKSCMRPC
jgi:hypothetical protein